MFYYCCRLYGKNILVIVQEQPGEQVKDAADETPAEIKVPAESRDGSKTQILILILIFAVIAISVIYFLKLKK